MDRVNRQEEAPLSVFTNMYSALKVPSQSAEACECLELPNIFGPPPEVEPAQSDIQIHKRREAKQVTACPHPERKHYAKNMCNNCYHKMGRPKYAWACPHPERKFYAKGKCQNCYLKRYHQRKSRRGRDSD